MKNDKDDYVDKSAVECGKTLKIVITAENVRKKVCYGQNAGDTTRRCQEETKRWPSNQSTMSRSVTEKKNVDKNQARLMDYNAYNRLSSAPNYRLALWRTI